MIRPSGAGVLAWDYRKSSRFCRLHSLAHLHARAISLSLIPCPLLLVQMRDLSTSFIKKVAHLPAVEAILVDYLMEEDEQWAAYLSEQFKAGVAFVDAFQQGLYNRFPSWTLPEPITRRLASTPTVKAAIVSYFTSVETKGTSILSQVVAANVEHMRDLQALVARHLDSLPTLKRLRDAHYEGIPELKHFDVRCEEMCFRLR